MQLALEAVEQNIIKTENPYVRNSERTDDHYLSVFVEPVSFFDWAKSQGTEIYYFLDKAVEEHRDKLRRKAYKDYKISRDVVVELMREPLWSVSHAIMYLHGLEPAVKHKYTYIDKDPNDDIVRSDDEMRRVNEYLHDSRTLGEIEVFSRSGSKIRPKDFMSWAASLNREFPNLISSPKQQQHNQLQSREKETLLKILLGLALTNYEYNPHASRNSTSREIAGDLSLQGISVDEDTVRKWLSEAKEYLPVDWNNRD
jgi:hypothetical protein